MESIKKFIQAHPDMMGIVGMYLGAGKDQYGEGALFEIAMNEEEEDNFIKEYQESGYKLADANYFGDYSSGLRACFMAFVPCES